MYVTCYFILLIFWTYSSRWTALSDFFFLPEPAPLDPKPAGKGDYDFGFSVGGLNYGGGFWFYA
jgi:hypothetical protein